METFKAHRPNSEVIEVPTEWDSAQAQEGVEAILNSRDDIKMVVNAWDGGTMGAKAALENLRTIPSAQRNEANQGTRSGCLMPNLT